MNIGDIFDYILGENAYLVKLIDKSLNKFGFSYFIQNRSNFDILLIQSHQIKNFRLPYTHFLTKQFLNMILQKPLFIGQEVFTRHLGYVDEWKSGKIIQIGYTSDGYEYISTNNNKIIFNPITISKSNNMHICNLKKYGHCYNIDV
jgi:hypothetical protein